MNIRRSPLIAKTPVVTIVKCILNRDFVPTDEEILAEVHMVRPDSRMDRMDLRWYKHRFRRGALAGMDGVCHQIKQPKSHMFPVCDGRSIPRKKRVPCVNGCPKCQKSPPPPPA